MAVRYLQKFLLEVVPLNTPLAAAEDTDDTCADEEEDCHLAAVLHEGIASIGGVGVQMRPGPNRAEGSVYSKVRDNHRYTQRARSQPGKNAEGDEECRKELYPSCDIYQRAKPVWIRRRRKAPQQERFLCAVQGNQECEDNPEKQIEIVSAWL